MQFMRFMYHQTCYLMLLAWQSLESEPAKSHESPPAAMKCMESPGHNIRNIKSTSPTKANNRLHVLDLENLKAVNPQKTWSHCVN